MCGPRQRDRLSGRPTKNRTSLRTAVERRGRSRQFGRAIRAKIPADGLLFTRSIGLADRPFDRFTQPAALAAVRRAAVAGAIVYPAARRRTGPLRRLRSTARVGLANNVGPAIRARIPAGGGFFMRSIGLANQPIDRFAQPAKKGSVIAILLCAHAAPNAALRRWTRTHIGRPPSLRNLPKKVPLGCSEARPSLPWPHPLSAHAAPYPELRRWASIHIGRSSSRR